MDETIVAQWVTVTTYPLEYVQTLLRYNHLSCLVGTINVCGEQGLDKYLQTFAVLVLFELLGVSSAVESSLVTAEKVHTV